MADGRTEFAEKLKSIRFGSVPGGTRAGQSRVDEINARGKAWDEDMPAYRRLRRDGLQPKGVDGAAQLERHAEDRVEIENRLLMTDSKIPGRIREIESEVAGKDVGV